MAMSSSGHSGVRTAYHPRTITPTNELYQNIEHVFDWGHLLKRCADPRVASMTDPATGKLWVIAEWERSITTLLLPEEY
jgi:hypothetical protein